MDIRLTLRATVRIGIAIWGNKLIPCFAYQNIIFIIDWIRYDGYYKYPSPYQSLLHIRIRDPRALNMARWIVNSLPLLLLLVAASQQARLISPPVDEFKQLETKGDQSLVRNIESRADDNSVNNYRLPNNTVPISYNVELWTEVHKGTRDFRGVVKIDIQVVEDTKTITLHHRQINEFSATIQSKDSVSSQPIAVTGSKEATREFLILTHTDTLKAGSNWTVTITYTSQLRVDMGGFYRSSYTDDSGAVQ